MMAEEIQESNSNQSKSQSSNEQSYRPSTTPEYDNRLLANEVVKYKRLTLASEGKTFTPYNMPAMKEITKDVSSFINEIDKDKAQRMDRQKIINDANSLKTALQNSFKQALQKDIDKLKQWQKDYRNAYEEEHLIPTDPQAETIKRQDFDTRLEVMDDQQLEDYVNSLNDRPKLSEYEVNRLMIKTKGKAINQQVIQYKQAGLYGKEYAGTEEWQRVAKTLFTLQGWQSGQNVWYLGAGNQGLQLLDVPNILRNKLNDYHVVDSSQR